jgi:hypothetical protein
MMIPTRIFPIGIQNFEQLRTLKNVYIDKTALVYQLVSTNRIYFLSRPRRFGKSLLLSTFKAYFEGKKELFEGLAMEKLEAEWVKYPVLYISFAVSKYTSVQSLQEVLNIKLKEWEEKYGRDESEKAYSSRFAGIIRRAYNKTKGTQVVILIDEYDSPLLDSQQNEELRVALRTTMRDFFSPLKDATEYIRFLFITGISKFSQLSIFSELNSLKNISMDATYSSICGITETELLTQMKEDIQALAKANKETYEEACAHLKRQYDGYHFSEDSEDIYNPFSVINVLSDKKYANYWFSTGTPTFLIELLQQMNVDLPDLESNVVDAETFDRATENITNPLPVLYQSGYLTIKSYDSYSDMYTLGYPNEEVRVGFIRGFIPSYLHILESTGVSFSGLFVGDLKRNNLESCMERTKAFFASIPYDLNNKTEKDFQTNFYIIFRLMGQRVDTEVKSAIGRADAVLKTHTHIYVFEFKVDGTPEQALEQINSKNYAIPYASDGRKVVKIGVNFDSATRTIGDWKTEE